MAVGGGGRRAPGRAPGRAGGGLCMGLFKIGPISEICFSNTTCFDSMAPFDGIEMAFGITGTNLAEENPSNKNWSSKGLKQRNIQRAN